MPYKAPKKADVMPSKASERAREAAERHAVANAHPMLRSMYTASRAQLAELLEEAFLAGRAYGLEEAAEIAEGQLRELADVYLNGGGNLTKEQKSFAHDNMLVAIPWLKESLRRAGRAEGDK